MGVLLVLAAIAACAIALVGAVKGSLPSLHLANRKQAAALFAAGFVLLLVGSAFPPPAEDPAEETVATTSPDGDLALEFSTAATIPARPVGVPADAVKATVIRHVDGDSLWLGGGNLPSPPDKSVRLLEIDTPEVGARYYEESSSFLEQELPIGATVYVLADEGDKDNFGRYLRYLWKENGEFFNEKTVRQGFAEAVLIAPNDRFIAQISAAESEAKAAKRGIWSPGSAPVPLVAPRPPVAATRPATAPPQVTLPPATVPVTQAPPVGAGCDPSYPDECIPSPPPDLDCGDIGHSVRVLQPDPHRLDGRAGQAGEPDGVGCETFN